MLASSTNLQHVIVLPATDTGDAGAKIEQKKRAKNGKNSLNLLCLFDDCLSNTTSRAKMKGCSLYSLAEMLY
jgi:hypothetical protein